METGAPAAPPSGLHKTMSEHSLAWDAVLEQAKMTALAPGTKALLVAITVCVCGASCLELSRSGMRYSHTHKQLK